MPRQLSSPDADERVWRDALVRIRSLGCSEMWSQGGSICSDLSDHGKEGWCAACLADDALRRIQAQRAARTREARERERRRRNKVTPKRRYKGMRAGPPVKTRQVTT